ncbi:MAG: YbjN domain-containing protein [Oscillospiraceae bacterium]|nr:YbjN domain-containing protein [Oscillospiraceae bacterium]
MASNLTLQVYQAFQAHLDKNKFKYDAHDEDLVISLTINGDDLPIKTIIRVIDERSIAQILCYCSNIPEDKRIDVAAAVAVANYGIVNGSFDYDISDGELRFRVTHNFSDGVPSDEVIRYLLAISFSTTDKYNDRFFMLGKGMMTLEQFIQAENK